MENQERHKQKIDILAKCIDANVITLQEALLLLDADIVKDEPAANDLTITPWLERAYYPPIAFPLSTPLTGTVLPHGGVGVSNISGTSTNTTYPQGTAVTYTNTVGSITETLSKQKK